MTLLRNSVPLRRATAQATNQDTKLVLLVLFVALFLAWLVPATAQEAGCVAAHTCLRPGAMEGVYFVPSSGVGMPSMEWGTTTATSGHGYVACWDQPGETTTCADVKGWDPGAAAAVPDGDLPFFAEKRP